MSNAPTTIGRYEILGAIGRGGMGSLYLALDPKLDRQLAIKLLRDDDDDLRERFAREARAAARLRHPNIVTIFDVGEHDGQPFIAMEYIQGQTLAEIVRGSVPLPLVRKLELMEALCDGLGFAHRGGIIHRDIKPANLMIDADGSLKILDFGIARAAESSSMTQAGMLIGTLNYMSPEQVSGQPVDLRSDLFAVGAVFYEVVSYRQAFPGGLMAGILNKIMSGQPEPLASIVPGVDAEVVRIVERALEKDPDHRYPDLPAMRQDIVLARARLAATEPMRVLGTTPAGDAGGEPRVTPPPSSSSRRTKDLEELARRRTEQIQSHLAAAESRLEAGDAEGAVAAAEQALLLDPTHAKAHGLVDRARAVIEARQLDEALDAAAGGIASGDFLAATQFIDRAAEIDPNAPRIAEVRRSLDDAVQRQEEARQREALEARVREVVADAERQFAEGRHDDGVALLAAFRPSHPIVAQALERLRGEAARLAEEARAAAERRAKQAAEVAERARREEEARLARERDRTATDAIKEAKRARGPEAALAILRPALERDPDNVDLLRAVGANEAELQRAQAKAAEEARRQAEREKAAAAAAAAAQVIPGVPSADDDDRTVLLKRDIPKPAVPPASPAAAVAASTLSMPVPVAKEPAPASAPEVKPAPAPAAKAPDVVKPAAAKAPARLASRHDEPITNRQASGSGGISNAVKYGGAAAAVLLVVMGFVLFGGGSADTPSTSDATGTATGEVTTGPVVTPPVDETPVVDVGPGTETASQGETAAVVPTPTTVPVQAPGQQTPPPQQQRPGTSAQDQQLDRLLTDAQQLRGGGDLRTALERVEDALKIRQNDARFTELANAIRQDAERRATAARNQAQSVGQQATALTAFRDGDVSVGRALQAAGAVDAARLLLTAEARFAAAATEGRRLVAAADEQRREQEAAQQRDLENQKATSAANTRAAEDAAIRSVVDQYRLGYNNNDANAVARVFPSVDAAGLRKGFANFSSQSMVLTGINVALDANAATATVTAQMVHTAQPRSGSRQENRGPITLSLRKQGNNWVIASRK